VDVLVSLSKQERNGQRRGLDEAISFFFWPAFSRQAFTKDYGLNMVNIEIEQEN